MSPFVVAEIAARVARIDPTLSAGRAAARLIAIGHCLSGIAGEHETGRAALDLLLEGAALCSAAATNVRFAAAVADVGRAGGPMSAACGPSAHELHPALSEV
jgi:hypothetical protein